MPQSVVPNGRLSIFIHGSLGKSAYIIEWFYARLRCRSDGGSVILGQIVQAVRQICIRLCTAASRRFLGSELGAIEATILTARLQHNRSCRCPAAAIAALIAAEDRRFYRHIGFDAAAIVRAGWKYMVQRRVSGASTIEQQLVRTIRRRYERTLRRKISEILLAGALQSLASKSEIATLYLRVAYFGWRMNGLRQALARLQISETHISRDEAAYIVALLKYPLPRRPTEARLRLIRRRQQYIVEHLHDSAD